MYLLSGSFAYDSILLHKGQFHARILPEALSRLNVSFGIDSVEDEFGGCGGNIAYNAALLGDSPMLCTSVGKDFAPYDEHLKSLGLNTQTLTIIKNEKTSHAWLLTDSENNQITGFSKGAMRNRPMIPIITPEIWHLAPDEVRTTAWLAKKAVEENKKYLFDPGQSMTSFLEESSEDIFPFEQIIANSTGIFVNEYEAQLIEDKLKVKINSLLSEKTEFIVQTLGSKGLILHSKGKSISIGVAKPNKIVDPTGCGDALRAGFLHGYTKSWTIEECAKLGSTMGSFAIEESGGQNHKPSRTEIITRFKYSF